MKRFFFAVQAMLLLAMLLLSSCNREAVTSDNIIGTWNVVEWSCVRQTSYQEHLMTSSMGNLSSLEDAGVDCMYTYVFNMDNTGSENKYYTLCPPDSAHDVAYLKEDYVSSEFEWSISGDNLKLNFTSGRPLFSNTYEAWLQNGNLYLDFNGTVTIDSTSTDMIVSLICQKIE